MSSDLCERVCCMQHRQSSRLFQRQPFVSYYWGNLQYLLLGLYVSKQILYLYEVQSALLRKSGRIAEGSFPAEADPMMSQGCLTNAVSISGIPHILRSIWSRLWLDWGVAVWTFCADKCVPLSQRLMKSLPNSENSEQLAESRDATPFDAQHVMQAQTSANFQTPTIYLHTFELKLNRVHESSLHSTNSGKL